MYEEELERKLETLNNQKITVSIDTRWSSRGFCANESTTTFFYFNEQEKEYSLLYTFNCIKRGIHQNYTGSSKAMEAYGTEMIVKKLVAKGITISCFVHDADSCTTAVVKKYFSEAKELVDRLHKQRSIKRRLYELEDKTLKKKDWIERVLKCTSVMLFNHSDSIENKRIHLDCKLNHWQNIHSQCKDKECKILYQPLPSAQVKIIGNILESIIDDHEKLSHNLHTNMNESFNSAILSFCPKNVVQPSLYNYKIARTGLQTLFKSRTDEKIFGVFQIKLKEHANLTMLKLERRREYVKKYQRSKAFKEARRLRLLGKRKLSLISKNDQSYGTVLAYCNCKGGKKHGCCGTKRCKCKQSAIGCNEKCKCKGNCKNESKKLNVITIN